MKTLGVDLAAQPVRTAACELSWSSGTACVADLRQGVSDEALLELVAKADRAGIDVPLGWPDPFVLALMAHRDGTSWPGDAMKTLLFRRTDLHIQGQTGRWPLSVSGSLRAIPALRAAAVLSRVPGGVDRSGDGRLVEVYPGAALDRWGLPSRHYKRKAGTEGLAALVAILRKRAPWLEMTAEQWAFVERSDDAFDALVAALIARAAALRLCDPIPADHVGAASREGWIALPAADSLDHLIGH